MLCPHCFHKSGPLHKERGQVKWFSQRKRYGFIVTQGGSEVFFHQNQLIDGNEHPPHEGQRTQFHVRSSVNGVEALNVELVDS
jgi:CspA family cold shock protein